jgi:hypothetical protein
MEREAKDVVERPMVLSQIDGEISRGGFGGENERPDFPRLFGDKEAIGVRREA